MFTGRCSGVIRDMRYLPHRTYVRLKRFTGAPLDRVLARRGRLVKAERFCRAFP